MPIVYSYSTNKGKNKKSNDDSVRVARNKKFNIMGIICDGVSSHKNSIFSSNYVSNHLICKWENTNFNEIKEIYNWLEEKIKEINEYLVIKSIKKNIKLGTTLVLTIFFDEYIIVANIGDSVAYGVKKNGYLELLSVDDSFAGILLNLGFITEEEAVKHPNKSLLTQSLGSKDSLNLHINKYKKSEFSNIILCSDGISSIVDKNTVLKIIRNNDLSSSIQKLINMSNDLGGEDDVSIIIFNLLGGD